MPKYLRNLDGTARKPRLSEGTMLSEGPVNDCMPSQHVSSPLVDSMLTAVTFRAPSVLCFFSCHTIMRSLLGGLMVKTALNVAWFERRTGECTYMSVM